MRTLSPCLLLIILLSSTPIRAQTEHPETPAPAPSAPTATEPTSLLWGLGLLHYQEPGWMRLLGPEAVAQIQHRSARADWPELLQLDLGASVVDYRSTDTGTLHDLPALNGRGTALWRLPVQAGVWRGGLQIDLAWTDLRGTSSTGHIGYRRLGSKAWAVLQHEWPSGTRLEAGVLLRGRQDSLLSDAGGRDITNIQRKGMYLHWQHAPIMAIGFSPRPWARLSHVERSDNDGRYYEPRNRTLHLGLLFDF